jgi:hypothetical protein
MSEATFTMLAIADRTELIEKVRRQLKDLVEKADPSLQADVQLAPASERWLRRMMNAQCNHHCSDERYLELDAELFEFYGTVPKEEAEELRRRLSTSLFIRNSILEEPDEEPLKAVLHRLERQAA